MLIPKGPNYHYIVTFRISIVGITVNIWGSIPIPLIHEPRALIDKWDPNVKALIHHGGIHRGARFSQHANWLQHAGAEADCMRLVRYAGVLRNRVVDRPPIC